MQNWERSKLIYFIIKRQRKIWLIWKQSPNKWTHEGEYQHDYIFLHMLMHGNNTEGCLLLSLVNKAELNFTTQIDINAIKISKH